MQTNIVSVKYEDKFEPKTFCGKAYNYYTDIPLSIGDLVVAPTTFANRIARVSEINIPEYKVETFKANLKLILYKIDKQLYLEDNEISILKEVA